MVETGGLAEDEMDVMDEETDGLMDGWMDGWVNGWIDG